MSEKEPTNWEIFRAALPLIILLLFGIAFYLCRDEDRMRKWYVIPGKCTQTKIIEAW